MINKNRGIFFLEDLIHLANKRLISIFKFYAQRTNYQIDSKWQSAKSNS